MKSCIQRFHKFPTVLSIACLAMLWGAPQSVLAEGRPVIDWSLQIPDAPPQRNRDDGALFTITASTNSELALLAKVLDANTDPPSPFPDGGQGLLVRQHQSGNTESVLVRMRPFLDMEPPSQGWLDLQIAPGDSRTNVDFGAMGDPTQRPDMAYTGQVILRAAFESGKRIAVSATFGEQTARTTGGPELETNRAYTFRIMWDLAAPEPGFRFLLDGEPLMEKADQPAFIPIPADSDFAQHGLDYIGVSMRSATLGNVTASE